MSTDIWVEEKHKQGFALRFKIKKYLFSDKSEFQTVDVVETEHHGRMLLNDGLVMCTERDEHIYHEMIAHVPLFVHPNPKKVLIIGGGDGGTAREVLRHQSVEACTMVEIDEMVCDACSEFIPQTADSLKNPKLKLIIDDGVKFVAETKEKFDVILVDSTDPIGPAAPLFGSEFYQNIHRCLTDDGIVVSQAETPFYAVEEQTSLVKILGEFFTTVQVYNFHNMSYPGGLWSFSFASKKYHPKDVQQSRVQQSGLTFNYYNVETHTSAFALPEFQKRNLKGLLKERRSET